MRKAERYLLKQRQLAGGSNSVTNLAAVEFFLRKVVEFGADLGRVDAVVDVGSGRRRGREARSGGVAVLGVFFLEALESVNEVLPDLEALRRLESFVAQG